MNIKRKTGIALVVGGIILFVIGLTSADSFSDRLSHFFSGNYNDQTVWYMMIGVAAFVFGLSFLPDGRSKPAA